MAGARLRVGVDTGGTFTDVLALEDGVLRSYKLSSTPGNFEQAVLEGAGEVTRGEAFDLVHSTTVATNALLERKGAKTALITTGGFKDLLEIGRQARPKLYDLMPRPVAPLVPRELRFELPERVGADGSVLVPLDLDPLNEIIATLRREQVASVAVLFLFSFLAPEHECRVGEKLEAAGFSVSLSHRVLPEFREVERGSTTVVNAYVRPVMEVYLKQLAEGAGQLGAKSLRIVQSNGGCLTPERAGSEAVQTLLSGPAAGVLGACTAAKAGGQDLNLITFDMGGTSTDVALIRGEPVVSTEQVLGGFPVGVPMVDVHTVGAGGGSIAAVDSGGALTVGPGSAGAYPGPACYGNAEDPTVTDAHVVLGHLRPEAFLQGRMHLDAARSRTALAKLGEHMGSLDAEAAARDVLRLVNTTMEAAIRVISVQRGHDPVDFTLVGFGGAGGLHVFALAEALNMKRVLVPCHPGVLSALGAVATPMRHETSQTVMQAWTPETVADLQGILDGLKNDLVDRFSADGVDVSVLDFVPMLEMRYRGQSHELCVSLGSGELSEAAEAFHKLHRKRYGHADPDEPVEVVTLRLRGQAPNPEVPLPELAERREGDSLPEVSSGVVRRDRLRRRDVVEGPALILEDFSTILVPAGWRVFPDRVGNLVGERI
ncbi:MAG: hydantoinase/oxoprolinase family protein [Verrucomicrobia bacterium]|nr:hydantoinase/oxoprolinase family protein [Verrucomicrobiota bacterium]MCH8511068.1 hydantoinase/oxoprolinase family protein [Kiritimatiellia bacterium]